MRRLLLALSLSIPALVAAAPALPSLAGKDLLGLPLAVPEALSGRAGVLVVGLTKASGQACQAWEDRLWADLGSNTGVAIYTVVQLQGAPGFVVPFIVKGIKKGKAAARFAQVLILREGRGALEAAVGFDPKRPDDAYVLLLDRGGSVRWKGHAPDLGGLDGLYNAMKALR